MLAVSLAVAACRVGFSIYFPTLEDMVANLKEAEATGRFQKNLQTYLKPSVLVIDEVGYLSLARAEASMVFQLVTGTTSGARSCSPPTRPSVSGARSSAQTSWPPPSWTGCCTTLTWSCRLRPRLQPWAAVGCRWFSRSPGTGTWTVRSRKVTAHPRASSKDEASARATGYGPARVPRASGWPWLHAR